MEKKISIIRNNDSTNAGKDFNAIVPAVNKTKVVISLFVAGIIMIACLLLSGCGADKAFEGTWRTSPTDNEKIKNSELLQNFKNAIGNEEAISFFKNTIDDAFSISLTFETGINDKVTIDLVGMTQEGTWKTSNANEGELTIGKANALFTRESDKLTLSNGKVSIDFYRE